MIPLQKWLPVLVLILLASTGFLGYSFLQERERANALEDANEIYEEDFERLQEENQRKIDSLQYLKVNREKQIDLRDQQIEEILSHVEDILKSTPNEKAIDNIHDSDSLSELFTRYYPDHTGAGQGSD